MTGTMIERMVMTNREGPKCLLANKVALSGPLISMYIYVCLKDKNEHRELQVCSKLPLLAK